MVKDVVGDVQRVTNQRVNHLVNADMPAAACAQYVMTPSCKSDQWSWDVRVANL